jgi:hypothetical protein
VDDAEGDCREAEEPGEEGLAAGDRGAGGREGCEKDCSADDERELFKEVAGWVEVGVGCEHFGHPQEGEDGEDDGEGERSGASGFGPEERNSGGELNERGEIGERQAERNVGADVLPSGGEVAGNETQDAKEDGAGGVGTYTEIACKAAFLHDTPAPVSLGNVVEDGARIARFRRV